jgi:Recombination directionality factor-like
VTELAVREERSLRPPIGLLVSTGDLVPTRDGKSMRPAQLGHFRFKPGRDGQYADAVAKAYEVYHEQPTELSDVLLLSRSPGDVLDIRVKAWAKSGLKIVGRTNYAALPRDEYARRVDAWDDDVLYRPRELKEVPKALRDSWQGEPIPAKLEGPGDPRIARFEMHVEATFRFTLPRVMGMGEVALYSTRSRHNRDQLFYGVSDAFAWFSGDPRGVPFTFKIRRRRTSYFDKGDRAYKPSETYEVVFSSPWTWAEAIEQIREQRAVLGSGAVEAPLALPSGEPAVPELFAENDQRRADDITDVPFTDVRSFDPDEPDVIEGEPVIEEEEQQSFFQIPEAAQSEMSQSVSRPSETNDRKEGAQ